MIANPRSDLGKILRERRLSIPLTLEEVAAASGVSISHLGRIENGERFPSGTVVRKIAGPLGYDENELFTLAGYLTAPSVMSEPSVPYNIKKIDPEVLKALSKEPVSTQRAVIELLRIIKSVSSSKPLRRPRKK
jgi:transcriptional regulator with XRE-family HTH domain